MKVSARQDIGCASTSKKLAHPNLCPVSTHRLIVSSIPRAVDEEEDKKKTDDPLALLLKRRRPKSASERNPSVYSLHLVSPFSFARAKSEGEER